MGMKYGITFHPSWWHKNAGIDFSQPFFDDPAYRIDCDIKMRKCLYENFGDYGIGEKKPEPRPLIGTDLLAAGYLHSEILGCEIIYAKDNSPQVCCKNISIEECAKIKAPNLDHDPVWQRMQKQIDWLYEKYGRVETYVNLMGVQNIALDLIGQELFLAYFSDPDEIRALLNEICILSADIGTRFKALSSDISGGVTSIIRDVSPNSYITSNCSVEMISNELYEDFLLEFDQKLADSFDSFAIHHCGRSTEHVCKGYSKINGVDFVEAGAGSDLAEVRRFFPKTKVNARYSPVTLANDSHQEIRDNVAALFEKGKALEGDPLISISCVGMDTSVPTENIREFLAACEAI